MRRQRAGSELRCRFCRHDSGQPLHYRRMCRDLRRYQKPRALLQALVLLAACACQGLNAADQPGSQTPPPTRRLVVVDREGRQTNIGPVPGNIWGPRVSPDGRQVAFTLTGGTRADDDMYVAPLMNPGEARPIGPGRNPYWSHDGARLFFSGAGTEILLWRRLDGDPAGEQLATPARAPESRSPDGRILSYVVSAGDHFSGWTLDLVTRTPSKIDDSGPDTLGTSISADGRWIAYQSTRSGRHEVYVLPLGRPGPAVQVSRDEGFRPLWSADMREMFFDDGRQQLWVVPIQTAPTFSVGPPAPLPIRGFVQTGVGRRMYDLLPDGRFVMVFP
jgi:Tol biopolymer transport system component